jgi:hypothetical protein
MGKASYLGHERQPPAPDLVAQDQASKGLEAAARRVEGRQAAQQIDQEILAQILTLADR